MIRVVLAFEQSLLMDGLVRLIATASDVRVVAAVRTTDELLAAVRQHEPTAVVAGSTLGMATARRLAASHPALGVLVVGLEGPVEIGEAVESGVRGHATADCTAAELLRAIRDVASGGGYLPPGMLRELMDAFRTAQRSSPKPVEIPDFLSAREREVLQRIARGHSNKQIARDLSIEVATVKTHLTRLSAKLNVQGRTEAAVLAVQQGWAA